MLLLLTVVINVQYTVPVVTQ